MKKTVFLSLTPAIKAELESGAIKREDLEDRIRAEFQDYMDMKQKSSGAQRGFYHIMVMDGILKSLDTPENKDMKDKITCRRGCNFCCYNEVTITWDEAALLYEISNDENFESRFKIDWNKVEEQRAVRHSTLAHEQRACVYLKDGECSVYEARPMACRKYFVQNDPEKCDYQKHPQGKTEVVYLRPAEMLATSMMSIQETGTMADMLYKVRMKLGKD